MDNLQTQDTPQPDQTAPVAVYQPPAVIPNNTVPPDDNIIAIDDGLPPIDRHGVEEFHIDWENQIDINDMKTWDQAHPNG